MKPNEVLDSLLCYATFITLLTQHRGSETRGWGDDLIQIINYSFLRLSQIIQGEFKVVTGAVMICACHHTPRGLTPSAHLGDGQVITFFEKKQFIAFLTYLWIHTTPTFTVIGLFILGLLI